MSRHTSTFGLCLKQFPLATLASGLGGLAYKTCESTGFQLGFILGLSTTIGIGYVLFERELRDNYRDIERIVIGKGFFLFGSFVEYLIMTIAVPELMSKSKDIPQQSMKWLYGLQIVLFIICLSLSSAAADNKSGKG